MKTHRALLAATGLVAALGLAGCWHDDDDDPVFVATVPDSAGESSAAFVDFILGLSASDETSEPLAIEDGFAVPADETAEPTPLT